MRKLILLILAASICWSQDISTAVIDGQSVDIEDPNLEIFNDIYDPEGSCWTWRYQTDSESDPPHRDLGQSFTPKRDFTIDKICVEIENELTSSQEHLTACQDAPFTMIIYEFPEVGSLEPSAEVVRYSGTLPAVLDSNEIVGNLFTLLEMDIPATPVQAGKVYAFLLCFDEMRDNQTLNLNKTHATDYYMDGAMLYRLFDGTAGRENVSVYEWNHPGSNANRDLNFWIFRGEEATAVSGSHAEPKHFQLAQNFPNPFNPETQIEYTLIKPQQVKLQIFNTQGQYIETLVDERQSAGVHTVTFEAQQLPSGIYFYRLETEIKNQMRRMLLLK